MNCYFPLTGDICKFCAFTKFNCALFFYVLSKDNIASLM